MPYQPKSISQILTEWSDGNCEALPELIPLVYEDLHRLARRTLRHKTHIRLLQPEILIHEVYIKMQQQNRVRWQNIEHFYGVAALIMRRTVREFMRRQYAIKRGRDTVILPLDAVEGEYCAVDRRITDLEDALIGLNKIAPLNYTIVRLRCFDGLTLEETSVSLGLSTATVERRWRAARDWLSVEIDRRAHRVF